MIAIFSDIHGNLEAFQAALVDAEQHGAQHFVCLGDLVGYGPDPIACIELVMNWPTVTRGFYDHSAMTGGDLHGWGSPIVKNTIFHFRKEMVRQKKESAIGKYLANLPISIKDQNAFYSHSVPGQPNGYFLYPEEIYSPQNLDQVATKFDRLCFCGHTHLPGIFEGQKEESRVRSGESSEHSWKYISAEGLNRPYDVLAEKTICNVGSVGQPRDENPSACYVLFDHGQLIHRRVEYDIEKTISKIKSIDETDDFLIKRLLSGR